MHTTKIGAYTFIHNSDMSGVLEIVNSSGTVFKIGPAQVVLDFVAQYIAGEKIAKLEQATTAEILGLKR
jgi:hypothetical protein